MPGRFWRQAAFIAQIQPDLITFLKELRSRHNIRLSWVHDCIKYSDFVNFPKEPFIASSSSPSYLELGAKVSPPPSLPAPVPH